MGFPFFGDVSPKDRERIILEPFFTLFYYGGFQWNEFYHFPVSYRRWLIKRIEKEIQRATEKDGDIPDKTLEHNTPQLRQLTGKFKPFVNAKNHRFT